MNINATATGLAIMICDAMADSERSIGPVISTDECIAYNAGVIAATEAIAKLACVKGPTLLREVTTNDPDALKWLAEKRSAMHERGNL